MDQIDYSILNILKHNARETASNISKEVHLSVSSVMNRIRQMEDSGIIKGYEVRVDSKKLGFDVTAFMEVSLEHPKYIDRFHAFVKENREILECHYITGDFDFMLRVVTDNTPSLEHLLNLVKSIPGVQNTRTILILSSVKEEHSVDPDELLK